MRDFEQALAEYRAALEAAAATAINEAARRMFEIHTSILRLIEYRYSEERDAADCRALIRKEQKLHEEDGLSGHAVLEMRAAFKRLARAASA